MTSFLPIYIRSLAHYPKTILVGVQHDDGLHHTINLLKYLPVNLVIHGVVFQFVLLNGQAFQYYFVGISRLRVESNFYIYAFF